MHFGSVRVNTQPDCHEIDVELFLNGIDRTEIRVQLYADAPIGGEPVSIEMTCTQTASDGFHPHVYHAKLSALRPANDYTARAIPLRSGVGVPLECVRIAWQR